MKIIKYTDILLKYNTLKRKSKKKDKEIERLNKVISELELDLKEEHERMKKFRKCYKYKLNEVEDLRKENK